VLSIFQHVYPIQGNSHEPRCEEHVFYRARFHGAAQIIFSLVLGRTVLLIRADEVRSADVVLIYNLISFLQHRDWRIWLPRQDPDVARAANVKRMHRKTVDPKSNHSVI